eukprot:scaffold81933_cov51-Cyclotella_meneghiniana.AAC.2
MPPLYTAVMGVSGQLRGETNNHPRKLATVLFMPFSLLSGSDLPPPKLGGHHGDFRPNPQYQCSIIPIAPINKGAEYVVAWGFLGVLRPWSAVWGASVGPHHLHPHHFEG